MILKYSIFENMAYKLKYMSFDWDDNILFMPTKIHMQKFDGDKWVDEDVSTEKFAQVRSLDNWRIINNDPSVAFSEFRDHGHRKEKAFLEDTKISISNKRFGPSWGQFIKCLVRGSIFSIITARGHEPSTIRKAVKYIIDTQLSEDDKHEMAANLTAYLNLFSNTDPLREFSFDQLVNKYLDSCDFVGITSEYFRNNSTGSFDESKPEMGKQIAMEMFVKKIHDFGKRIGREVSLGFSDDDIGNVNHIHKFFKNESSLKYVIDYSVFDTSNPHNEPLKLEKFLSYKEYNSYSNSEWYKPNEL